MTKKELVTNVAQNTGYAKKDVVQVIDTLFDVIADTVSDGESVKIPGFGVFDTVERHTSVMKDFHTGEPINIEARMIMKFKPSRILKEKVRGEV